MKIVIEKSIQDYIVKHNNEYPEKIEINERVYRILNKEVKKEYKQIKEEIGDIEEFRGCKLIIKNDVLDFKVI